MAGSRIKGITVEIGGDTTKLQSALKGVDGALKTTQANLKDINRLLKMDPTNVNLLKQKQDNLSKAIADTKDRLNVLKDAYKQLDGQETEEAKRQQEALAREISETESKLKSLKKEMSDFGSVAKQELQAVGDKMKNVGDSMTDVGKNLTTKLTAPLLAVGTIGVSYNAQMEQLRVLFTTLTGSAEEADRVIQNIQADASRSPFDVQSLIKANQYLISAGVDADAARQTILDLGNAIAATGGGSDELDRMAMNLQQIRNVGKATAQDIKQFANAGINIYGLLAESMGVSVEKVKEMDISYEILADALAKASQEGGKYYAAMESQSQTMTGSISQLKSSIQMLLGEITSAAMPIIMEIIGAINNVVTWLRSLDSSQKELILKIAAVVAAIGPALIIAGKVVSVIGTVISALGLLFTPMGAVVAGIVALTAAVIKNKDIIVNNINSLVARWKNGWNDMVNTLKNIGTNLMNTARNTFNNIVSFVQNQVNKLKNLFNFSWSLPSISLPHFFSSGNTGPLGLPKIEVQWYAKAMKNGLILDEPTIFGASGGKLLGAGEAGSELIIGTNSLMDMISKVAGGTTVNMTVNGGNVSANELAEIVADKLTTTIRRNNQRW